jgi:hypothetical protein
MRAKAEEMQQQQKLMLVKMKSFSTIKTKLGK